MDPSIRQQLAWSPGQRILNDTGAREPEHTLDPPVPVTARIVWEDDGEEYIDTEAGGWGGQLVYVRMPDRRYRLTSVWLDAVDVGGAEGRQPPGRQQPRSGDGAAVVVRVDVAAVQSALSDGCRTPSLARPRLMM